MDLEKIVIIPSKSRYELEIARYGGELRAKQEYVPALWENLRDGHLAQKCNLSKLQPHIHDKQIVDRKRLIPALIDKYDAFVFLGGDNHFTYCSQLILKYLQDNPGKRKLVFGTVLDSKRSWGGQLYFTVDEFIEFLPRLKNDYFKIEEWTALEAAVKNGRNTTFAYPAINELFAGETKRWLMSRNYVYVDGKEVFPDKSSGILIATGTGSGNGSWYDNVHSVTFWEDDVFPRTAEYAKAILTEHKSCSKITLHKGQILTIYSSNDNRGIILPDSHEKRGVFFPMGAAAEVKIASVHLPVVCK